VPTTTLKTGGNCYLGPLQTLSVPISLGSYFLTKGTFEFNAFRTLCCLKAISNGHLKRSKANLKAVSDLIGLSERTIQAHIDYLIESKLVRFNPNTQTLFLIGWEKLATMLGTPFRKAVLVENLKHLKLYLFSGKANALLKAQKTLPCLKELPKGRSEPIQSGKWSGRGRKLLVVDSYKDFNGISCDVLRQEFSHSRMWSSRMKQAARKEGLLGYGKTVRVLAESETVFNMKHLSASFPLEFHKCFIIWNNGRYLFVERMADSITTSVCVSRKRLACKNG